MSRYLRVFSVAVVLAMAAPAQAADWQLRPAEGNHGAVLTLGAGEPVSYRFECDPNVVIVTETGVTKLIDLKSGKPIGDDADAIMPPGAAKMALFNGKGDPQFVAAEAVKNRAGGWDLTIRLPKNDTQLGAISKSEMMSLFTTGYTMAVVMDPAARAKWNDFIQRCKIAA